MFEHLAWANQSILTTLQALEEEDKTANRLFAHILLAEQVWYTRIKGIDSTQLPIWAEYSLEACSNLCKHNQQNFEELVHSLSEEDLEQKVSYCNSKGHEFMNSIGEILTHVALHGHYHRGQINQQLRTDGQEPVNIDFITFKR